MTQGRSDRIGVGMMTRRLPSRWLVLLCGFIVGWLSALLYVVWGLGWHR